MKIIIPMTGYGSRFVAAGYKELKPLIRVNGVPVIEWSVRGMFPGQADFLFVCRQEHLDTVENIEERLHRLARDGVIFAIQDWVKKGPVYDVLRAAASIPDDMPCAISYCDFYMTWDWTRFQRDVAERGCDGCVPCYTGYHPHLTVRKNLYASCLTDSEDNLIEIREKFSFAEDKTKALHSPGIYYFRTGALLKEYCQKLVDDGPALNGEYYASLPYNYMVRDGRKVWVPVNVERFCQWGTPEDMADYNFYMDHVLNWR